MDENNTTYIYPTIATCIEKMDRLTDKEYKFTIPSINFNKSSSEEDKSEEKNQGITNIANDKKVSIGKVEINNYFMIYVPKELMSTSYTTIGMSGNLEGDGYNYSRINFRDQTSSGGGIDTSITIPPHPYSSYTISSIIISAFRLGAGMINGIKQYYDSFKMSVRTSNDNSGITIEPKDRYIKKGSQWIVIFIDGDPSKPAIIARYR